MYIMNMCMCIHTPEKSTYFTCTKTCNEKYQNSYLWVTKLEIRDKVDNKVK